MKKLLVLLLIFTSSCATVRTLTPRQKIAVTLSAFDWSIAAAHDYGADWLSDTDVTRWNLFETSLNMALASQPDGSVLSIAYATAKWFDDNLDVNDKIKPYVHGVVLGIGAYLSIRGA